jgi:hypothetical protein
MITNVTEYRKKHENALLEQFLESYFVLLYNVFFTIVSKQLVQLFLGPSEQLWGRRTVGPLWVH